MELVISRQSISTPVGQIRNVRVGLIVGGSLLSGFVASLVLVVGLFGGAQ